MRNILATALLILFSSFSYADFGLHVSNLDGTSQKTIVTSKYHQMSHPKVSPDGKYVVFTRYNDTGADKLAEELDGYENTEICICTINGESVETLIPPKKGVMNCNASWTKRGIMWISSQNGVGIPMALEFDLGTRKIRRINTPVDQIVLDPTQYKDDIIYSSIGVNNGLWRLQKDTATQLTMSTTLDADPQVSPDGRNIAFIRNFGGNFHIMRYNFQSKKVTDLSRDKSDTPPCWSADSKTLVFFHINTEDFGKMGMYKMDPNGYNRTLLPLKRGYIYNQPSFFPGSSSRIIYQGFDVKGLP